MFQFYALIFLVQITSTPIPLSSTLADSIYLHHHCIRDLTSDGNSETISVTAEGTSWDSLAVLFEISTSSGDVLFAHQWSSADWLGGSYYLDNASDIKDWVTDHVARIVNPYYFNPDSLGTRRPWSGAGGSDVRNWYPSLTLYHQCVKADLAMQRWRETNQLTYRDRPWRLQDWYEAYSTFIHQVDDMVAASLMDEIQNSLCFVYQHHFDGIDGLAWSHKYQRFVHLVSIL